MKVLVLILVSAFFSASCDRPEDRQLQWYHRKSPLSGRCYEIVTTAQGSSVPNGMAEIPCNEAIFYKSMKD